MHRALTSASLQSSALQQVQQMSAMVVADPNFQALQADLPELRAPLERITSLTVGINLDVELKPKSAVLLSINDYKVGANASWVLRVMGLQDDATKPEDRPTTSRTRRLECTSTLTPVPRPRPSVNANRPTDCTGTQPLCANRQRCAGLTRVRDGILRGGGTDDSKG